MAPSSDLPLAGQTALVTGGGSGIGLAAAVSLARDGASIVIAGRSQEKLDAGLAAIGEVLTGAAEVRAVATDVTDESQVEAAVAEAATVPGRLAICVASAGDGTVGPIVATNADEWNRVIAVSLTGVFHTFKHAANAMIAAGSADHGAAMVAVSSIAGLVTHRHMGPYNVAKAGVDMLVDTSADELGAVGIRVNSVNPGIIRTDLVAMITEEGETGQSYLRNMPISRFGEVEDVAAAIRYLAGPESSFVTGVHLAVDGGHHLRCGPDYGEIARMLYSEVADARILAS